MKEIIVQPKPGIIICNGKYKIYKYNDLNISIAKKTHEPKEGEYANVIKDTTNGVIRKYVDDGYKHTGNYFNSVESAVRYLILKHMENDILDSKDVQTLEEFLKAMQSQLEQISKEVRDLKV